MNPRAPNDLTRITLVVLIIGILIAGSLWTLLPFLSALTWATMIVVATWPLLLRAQRATGNRRWIATTIMTGVMLAIFVAPFALAIGKLLTGASDGLDLAQTFLARGLPPPPEWLERVPILGQRIADPWRELVAGGPDAITEAVQPYLHSIAAWILSATGSLGMLMLHFMLTAVIAAILYAHGEPAAEAVLMFARRVGGARGDKAVRLAAAAIRGVALGVVVTAIVQSLFAGLGLWVAGVPRPGLLLAVIFVLGVAQIGPLPVLLPAVGWLYWTGNVGWAAALLVWTVLVGTMDNFLRPVLIRRGVDLPLLLIIPGVIGGLIAFGVVGLFIGPVLLAVTYTLLESWIREDPAPPA
ncbi:MAG TPA: AI-2E family transporter YdiK [Burkholderiales bacterium]|nr:AI-2E family transporter YdiK [Burkholderiales bacterium]